MKVIFLSLCLLVCISLCIYAQSFNCGVLTGLILSNSYTPDAIDSEMLFGSPMISGNVNLLMAYHSKGKWGISLEPGFIQKGWRYKNPFNYQDFNRVKLNYFQLPVLVEYRLRNNIYLSGGSELAYLANAKLRVEDFSVDMNGIYNRKFELSGILGIHYKIFEKIDVGLRMNIGLTNISTYWTLGNQGPFNDFNLYSQVVFRYLLGGGEKLMENINGK